MPKHARIPTEEQRQRRARNRSLLTTTLAGMGAPKGSNSTGLTLVLERFVVDRTSGRSVSYAGRGGLAQLLDELVRTYQGGAVMADGRLVGVAGELALEGHVPGERLALRATVGAGGQLALELGPSNDLVTLADAIAVFDRQVHVAGQALGRDLELVAQGYNPTVSSPDEIEAVPTAHHNLMGAYLARTGAYGRDLLRCTATTLLRLPVGPRETATQAYQVLAAAAPVLAFLTDNSCHLRGASPAFTPQMTRALVFEQADPARCGLVPGSFDTDFGPVAYAHWLEDTRPVVLTSADGVTFSCGLDSCGHLMEERDLDGGELRQMLDAVWPWARWNGSLELLAADALPTRLALSYAALIKGLLATEDGIKAAGNLLRLDSIGEQDVLEAWGDLRAHGWQARPLGRPIMQIAHELVAISSQGLAKRDERRMLDELAQLWDVQMVPRDLLAARWEQTSEAADQREAAQLWGEGALVAYEDLDGDPPAGATAELPVLRDVSINSQD